MSICLFTNGNVYLNIPDPAMDGKSGFVSINNELYPFNSENGEIDLAIWTPSEGWTEDTFALEKLMDAAPRTLDLIHSLVDEFNEGSLVIDDNGISKDADNRIARVWEKEIGNIYRFDNLRLTLNPEEWLIKADGTLAVDDGTNTYQLEIGDKLLTRRVYTHGFDPSQWEYLTLAQKCWFTPVFSIYKYVGRNSFEFISSNLDVSNGFNVEEIIPTLAIIDDVTFNGRMLQNYNSVDKIVPICSLAVTAKEHYRQNREVYYEASLPFFYMNGEFWFPQLKETEYGLSYAVKSDEDDIVAGYVQFFTIEGSAMEDPVIAFYDSMIEKEDLTDEMLKDKIIQLIKKDERLSQIFYPY